MLRILFCKNSKLVPVNTGILRHHGRLAPVSSRFIQVRLQGVNGSLALFRADQAASSFVNIPKNVSGIDQLACVTGIIKNGFKFVLVSNRVCP